jgi:hypothetical protein
MARQCVAGQAGHKGPHVIRTRLAGGSAVRDDVPMADKPGYCISQRVHDRWLTRLNRRSDDPGYLDDAPGDADGLGAWGRPARRPERQAP